MSAPRCPGRDELAAGEMWNSNSIISWLLATAGVDADHIELPSGGAALPAGMRGSRSHDVARHTCS
jgi:hypothetical protein